MAAPICWKMEESFPPTKLRKILMKLIKPRPVLAHSINYFKKDNNSKEMDQQTDNE